MNAAPTRRWFRFSLRTLFVVLTVSAVFLGWFAYQLNWIRQRREFLKSQNAIAARNPALIGTPIRWPVDAPGLLWLFGERGQGHLTLAIVRDGESEPDVSIEIEKARRLFPEAVACSATVVDSD